MNGASGNAPHPALAAYIEQVVYAAYSKGMLQSDRGHIARFAELLGDGISRQKAWTWVWSYGGVPRNRVGQIKALNERIGLKMSEDALEKLLSEEALEGNNVDVLFAAVAEAAIGRSRTPGELRQEIAERMGISPRTMFRWQTLGQIPRNRLNGLKAALDRLQIDVSDDIWADVVANASVRGG